MERMVPCTMRLTLWTQRLLAVVFLGLTAICGVLEATHWQYKTGNGGDMHGGIPMGVSDDNCDNAKDYLWVDWDNSKEDYSCQGLHWFSKTNVNTNRKTAPFFHCQKTDLDRPIHKCMDEAIEYDDPIPTNGAHRPLWAKYGEYQYLPKQRWLHNLEHGAAVFLYHPCADPTEVDELRKIATSCLWKHIITPFKELSRETPFAVLTYGCKLLLPHVDDTLVKQFLQDHAMDAPEQQNYGNGQFDVGLEVSAQHQSDDKDRTRICEQYTKRQQFKNGFQNYHRLF